MTKEESAAYLGISVRSLQRLTAEGLFHPVTVGVKGVAVYEQAELDAWKSLSEEERRQLRKTARPLPAVTTRTAVTTNLPQNRPLLLSGEKAKPEPLPPSELASKLLLTLAEAALLTGLGRATLNRARREGKLRAVHIGGSYRFRPADLRSFIEEL